MKRTATLLLGLMLVMSLAAFAQSTKTRQAASTKAVVTHQLSGVISSVQGNDLVLTRKVKGKEEQTTFVMNGETMKHGTPKAGEKATIHYKVENKENIATMVSVQQPKGK